MQTHFLPGRLSHLLQLSCCMINLMLNLDDLVFHQQWGITGRAGWWGSEADQWEAAYLSLFHCWNKNVILVVGDTLRAQIIITGIIWTCLTQAWWLVWVTYFFLTQWTLRYNEWRHLVSFTDRESVSDFCRKSWWSSWVLSPYELLQDLLHVSLHQTF